jgi:uncharacterized small protein (TIGR04563 family)
LAAYPGKFGPFHGAALVRPLLFAIRHSFGREFLLKRRGTMNPGGRKRSFYFPDWMTREVVTEASRLDRSLSWILQQAWRLARAEMQRAPSRTPGPVPTTPHPEGSQDGKRAPA